jgi:hypothetical protein
MAIMSTPVSTGNNFIAEDDIVQTLEDGRVILLASKGAAVPMPVAERMGLPELAKRGIKEVTPEMSGPAGPGSITLGLSPDQIQGLDGGEGEGGESGGQGTKPTTTKEEPSSAPSTTEAPSTGVGEPPTHGSGSTDGTTLAPGEAAGDTGEAPEGAVATSASPSGFMVVGAPSEQNRAAVQVLDLHESSSGQGTPLVNAEGSGLTHPQQVTGQGQPKRPGVVQSQVAKGSTKPKAAS